jgi:hypothetical protein
MKVVEMDVVNKSDRQLYKTGLAGAAGVVDLKTKPKGVVGKPKIRGFALNFLPRLSDSSSDSAQAGSQIAFTQLEDSKVLDLPCFLSCFLPDVLAGLSELCNNSRVSRYASFKSSS